MMMLNRLLSGKILVGGLVSVGVGCSSAIILPNTVFIKEWQEVIQMYRTGAPVPVSEKVLSLVNKVMDDMKLKLEHRERIIPFTVFGFEVYHAGSMYSKYGTRLGIPANFYYSTVDDIDTENIAVQNRPINWLSPVADSFKKNLIFSEEAQKFLIAREIFSANTPVVFVKSMYPLISVFLIGGLSWQIKRRLSLLQKSPTLRGLLYILTSLFSLGLYIFCYDFTTLQTEFQADKSAAALGEEYIRGGLEAYTKILQRNICLRELMGSTGPSIYTPAGNCVYFFRQKHLPISHRKLYLESILNEAKSDRDSVNHKGNKLESAIV